MKCRENDDDDDQHSEMKILKTNHKMSQIFTRTRKLKLAQRLYMSDANIKLLARKQQLSKLTKQRKFDGQLFIIRN